MTVCILYLNRCDAFFQGEGVAHPDFRFTSLCGVCLFSRNDTKGKLISAAMEYSDGKFRIALHTTNPAKSTTLAQICWAVRFHDKTFCTAI